MITNNIKGSKTVTQIQDGGDDMLVIYAKLLMGYSFFFFFFAFYILSSCKNTGPLLHNISR